MKKMNDNILKITYVFVGLFALLAVYLLIYLFTDGKEDINNSYNKRQELLAEKVVRGTIYSNDMTVLAETQIDESGNETRVYPYDELFCHVVGSFDMGKYGLESSYNFDLLTSDASIIEEVVAELNNEKLNGNSIVTTLDIDLQSVCYEALGDYDGAVMVMDAKTGDVLAMVSKPDYNPNDIAKIWSDIKAEDSGILVNRVTQGLYPPGSVFKLFTLGEYIDTHRETYQDFLYTCEGIVDLTDFSMKCSNKKAHGELDLMGAFSKSCNCAFVEIGSKLDSDALREYCNKKLFNQELPIDISYKKSSFTLGSSDSEFVKSQTVIGQGETLVTPIHMCMVMSSIANDGILMKPRFVEKIIDKNGNTVSTYEPDEYIELYSVEDSALLKEYLREVVNSGTASKLKSDSYDAYGKTGTAQLSTEGMADSWFVGGVETESGNVYAIAVVLENVSENSSPSIGVTKEILKHLD